MPFGILGGFLNRKPIPATAAPKLVLGDRGMHVVILAFWTLWMVRHFCFLIFGILGGGHEAPFPSVLSGTGLMSAPDEAETPRRSHLQGWVQKDVNVRARSLR